MLFDPEKAHRAKEREEDARGSSPEVSALRAWMSTRDWRGQVPLYVRISVAILLQAPSEGELMRLPPERELADRFSVARVTVRKALDVLTHLGLLERRRRTGTFLKGSSPPPSHVCRSILTS
ncbi:GntR family transcriptional regulator [Caulobacter segnis]|uniref:HTH gntR-type domain-containing protein n=1 Tax=Caulobacter segnis TaxID=88688 RepID=A0A2W5V9Y0_9CAUL|nr:GntR family transcriptional regulator [Caulobacter segnis]PZR35467.1 MAG: hypothetical protein DI526_06820 [Caulobacter segnis]